jgi:hypothetical protein
MKWEIDYMGNIVAVCSECGEIQQYPIIKDQNGKEIKNVRDLMVCDREYLENATMVGAKGLTLPISGLRATISLCGTDITLKEAENETRS